VENTTPSVTDRRSPDELERDMERTRESITEKVAALENQVIGTIQTATDTVSDTVNAVKETISTATGSVSDTVNAVKDTISAAPSAVRETIHDTIESVKDSVRSFSITGCISNNPGAALTTSILGGFLTGYLTGSRSIMARGRRAPAPMGYAGTEREPQSLYNGPAAPSRREEPGFFGNLFQMASQEIQKIAEQAMNTAIASLKSNVETKVPDFVEQAVSGLTDRISNPSSDGREKDRHDYAARTPAYGI